MNCQEFRAVIGADPRQSNADVEAHAAACAECALWRRDMLRMDDVLRRALTIDIADAGATRAAPPLHAWRGWAMAAGAACATLVAGLLWFAIPRTSLADEVVAHMSEEPAAWARTDIAADPSKVARVLSQAGVRVSAGAGAGLLTYANSCWFRGHFVPHLVFQTAEGPVTVMVLTTEHVEAPVAFDEEGYRGVLLPAQRGALAILARGAAPPGEVTARVQAAMDYAGK